MNKKTDNEIKEPSDFPKMVRGCFYWDKDDVPYVRVTECLGVIDKPAIRYWYAREVYRATIVDPSMSEKEAMAAPYKATKKAQDRGITVHTIVEAWKQTKEYLDNVPDQFEGYAEAFYKWVEDYQPEIIDHERVVFSSKYKFAGTCDLLQVSGGADKPIVTDVKTGKDLYDEVFLQTSAYRQGFLEEDQEVGDIAGLLLKKDGTYKYERRPNHLLKQYLAAKELWEWKNAEMMEKIKKYRRNKQRRQFKKKGKK